MVSVSFQCHKTFQCDFQCHNFIFAIKPPILIIVVLEDRYESPLSIDTKKVPVALHMTSQCRFHDVRVTKNWILRILDENRPNFKIFGKNPRNMRF